MDTMHIDQVHFIGVGGVGMSGIARVAFDQGMRVSGTDLKESRYTKQLREAGIEVRTCADEVLGLGLTAIRTPYGNEVSAYDLERTLCDIVRGRRVVDVQVVNPAMKQYARSGGKDVQKLLDYAQALGVEKKIRNYLEVLL